MLSRTSIQAPSYSVVSLSASACCVCITSHVLLRLRHQPLSSHSSNPLAWSQRSSQMSIIYRLHRIDLTHVHLSILTLSSSHRNSVSRVFHEPGIHNAIQALLIDRVKYLVGYPESSGEQILPSLKENMDLYGEGPVRSLHEYMVNVGLDPSAKEAHQVDWCYHCQAPRPSGPLQVEL